MKPALPLVAAGVALVLTKAGRRALLLAAVAAGVAEVIRRRQAEGSWHDVPPPGGYDPSKERSASGR